MFENRDVCIQTLEKGEQQASLIPPGDFGGFTAEEINMCRNESVRLTASFQLQRKSLVKQIASAEIETIKNFVESAINERTPLINK